MSGQAGRCAFRLVTAPPQPAGQAHTRAAIAMIALWGDIDAGFASLKLAPVRTGEVRLRRFAAIDQGVVARFGDVHAALFPHAGPLVLRQMLDWLRACGLQHPDEADPLVVYPEARSVVEARMLATLARAASPLAIDLLLDQPRRWSSPAVEAVDEPANPAMLARAARLRHLIDPPLVAIVGRPNIGKSTLVNALAGRSAAVVADQPGTTRDAVGVMLDLAGLVVRYLDLPGFAEANKHASTAVDAAAGRLALSTAARADLLLLASDPMTDAVEPQSLGLSPALPTLRVRLRADLDARRGEPGMLCVSAHTGAGMAELVAAIRDRLVPPADLADPAPWRFW
jgi:hypothetical protein